MNRSRPAVLSGALIARKGAAAPTGYTPIRPRDVNAGSSANENAAPPDTDYPAPEAVSATVSAIAPARAATGAAAATEGERARVSVRLDPDRHLKLRLTAAHLHNSLQNIMTDALDRYLEQIGRDVLGNNCTCLNFKNAAVRRNWQSD